MVCRGAEGPSFVQDQKAGGRKKGLLSWWLACVPSVQSVWRLSGPCCIFFLRHCDQHFQTCSILTFCFHLLHLWPQIIYCISLEVYWTFCINKLCVFPEVWEDHRGLCLNLYILKGPEITLHHKSCCWPVCVCVHLFAWVILGFGQMRVSDHFCYCICVTLAPTDLKDAAFHFRVSGLNTSRVKLKVSQEAILQHQFCIKSNIIVNRSCYFCLSSKTLEQLAWENQYVDFFFLLTRELCAFD